MRIFVVYREYLNWKENNGAEVVSAFDSLDKAEEEFERIYKEEMGFLEMEEYKIVSSNTGRQYAEISTVYGDINIYIKTLEVK